MNRTLELNFDQLADLMREVGFVDVVLRLFKIPIGRWPVDPQLKDAGALQLVAMLEGIESLSLAVFTRCLHWEPLEVQILLAKARKEFCMKKNTCTGHGRYKDSLRASICSSTKSFSIKSDWDDYSAVILGRKPGSGTTS